MAITLKEVSVGPAGGYAEEFFTAVAKAPEGKFYEYEQPTTAVALRSAAYNYGRRLKKKFTVRAKTETLHNGSEASCTTILAVALTSKVRTPRRKKESAPVETPQDGQFI